jgi:hypothetical protein
LPQKLLHEMHFPRLFTPRRCYSWGNWAKTKLCSGFGHFCWRELWNIQELDVKSCSSGWCEIKEVGEIWGQYIVQIKKFSHLQHRNSGTYA